MVYKTIYLFILLLLVIYDVTTYAGTLEDLSSFLEKGKPLIAKKIILKYPHEFGLTKIAAIKIANELIKVNKKKDAIEMYQLSLQYSQDEKTKKEIMLNYLNACIDCSESLDHWYNVYKHIVVTKYEYIDKAKLILQEAFNKYANNSDLIYPNHLTRVAKLIGFNINKYQVLRKTRKKKTGVDKKNILTQKKMLESKNEVHIYTHSTISYAEKTESKTPIDNILLPENHSSSFFPTKTKTLNIKKQTPIKKNICEEIDIQVEDILYELMSAKKPKIIYVFNVLYKCAPKKKESINTTVCVIPEDKLEEMVKYICSNNSFIDTNGKTIIINHADDIKNTISFKLYEKYEPNSAYGTLVNLLGKKIGLFCFDKVDQLLRRGPIYEQPRALTLNEIDEYIIFLSYNKLYQHIIEKLKICDIEKEYIDLKRLLENINAAKRISLRTEVMEAWQIDKIYSENEKMKIGKQINIHNEHPVIKKPNLHRTFENKNVKRPNIDIKNAAVSAFNKRQYIASLDQFEKYYEDHENYKIFKELMSLNNTEEIYINRYSYLLQFQTDVKPILNCLSIFKEIVSSDVFSTKNLKKISQFCSKDLEHVHFINCNYCDEKESDKHYLKALWFKNNFEYNKKELIIQLGKALKYLYKDKSNKEIYIKSQNRIDWKYNTLIEYMKKEWTNIDPVKMSDDIKESICNVNNNLKELYKEKFGLDCNQ